LRIEVRLFASLERFVPGSRAGEPFVVELDDGASWASLLDAIGVDGNRIHLAYVNGRAVSDRSRGLSDGDRVGLFPPVGGG